MYRAPESPRDRTGTLTSVPNRSVSVGIAMQGVNVLTLFVGLIPQQTEEKLNCLI